MARRAQRRGSRKPSPVQRTEVVTIADYYKERLGWKPSTTPFHTTANRECGRCGAIKPGREFDVPVTPGRPDRNVCRTCLSR